MDGVRSSLQYRKLRYKALGNGLQSRESTDKVEHFKVEQRLVRNCESEAKKRKVKVSR